MTRLDSGSVTGTAVLAGVVAARAAGLQPSAACKPPAGWVDGEERSCACGDAGTLSHRPCSYLAFSQCKKGKAKDKED